MQVEALIVEILRLQKVVVDKHHPFAGQHHHVTPLHPTQSAVADQRHVQKRDPTPHMIRENAYSQMHADNILTSFLTQLQNLEEEDEDCDGRMESATFSAENGENDPSRSCNHPMWYISESLYTDACTCTQMLEHDYADDSPDPPPPTAGACPSMGPCGIGQTGPEGPDPACTRQYGSSGRAAAGTAKDLESMLSEIGLGATANMAPGRSLGGEPGCGGRPLVAGVAVASTQSSLMAPVKLPHAPMFAREMFRIRGSMGVHRHAQARVLCRHCGDTICTR